MYQPVSWLEFITVIAVFLLAEIVFALWQARGTLRELLPPKAGDEAAPDRQDGDSADPTRAGVQPAASSPQPLCSGVCMTGHDIGLPSDGIAYPHPDCELHGHLWTPYDNEWSRRYVAEHPDRFPSGGGQ